MPTLTIGDVSKSFPEGTRLVNAIEALGFDVGHRCGGKARCTTCRVEVQDGEPEAMTEAEAVKLAENGLLGSVRLSCQVLLDQDMTVTPVMTLQTEGWTDTGPATADAIEPEPVWTTVSEAKERS